MPRDSHLLPLHSQQLLRAARRPPPYKPRAQAEEDREIEEEEEPKEVQHGFTVKKFVKVPRHLEEAEPEYLAKRRKGLPSQYAVTATSVNPTPLRETKVKKVDAEGNVSVYKALVPEGQTVEGEVQPTEVALVEAAPAAAAPGTVVEGVGIVNSEGVVVVNEIAQQTPPRRRVPPPKKKKGGPGRKKKVVFVEGSTEQGAPASSNDLLAVPRVKQEGGSVEPSDGDTPMADAGNDDDGEEESEDDDEDRAQTPMATPLAEPSTVSSELPSRPETADGMETTKQPSPPPAPALTTSTNGEAATETMVPLPKQEPETTASDLKLNTEQIERPSRDPSSSPELPLSAMTHSRHNSMNQAATLPPVEPPTTSAPVAPHATAAAIPPEPLALSNTAELRTEAEPMPITQVVQESIQTEVRPAVPSPTQPVEENHGTPSEPDLLGSLEAHLDQDRRSMAGS
jgi:hypothetical protein